MKFIFPILSIVVCLGAAYFSLAQSGKFSDVQGNRIEAMNKNKSVSAKADVADKNIADEEALLEQSKDALALATQSASSLESDTITLKKDLEKIESKLAGQQAEFAELEKGLEGIQGVMGPDIDMDSLPEKMAELSEEVKAKRTKADELEALIEGAKSSLVAKRSEVERLVERKKVRNKRFAGNGMEARITAVNQDWGFLVIGAGKNSGFTPQTTLLVKRNGRLIGKVKPSAVEPTQTIAEIDLKSLSPGVRIQPGDRVILAKPAGN